jgi:hypothetical protein
MKNMRCTAHLIVLSFNCSRSGEKFKISMVERNMSKFERWINKLQSEEEFLFEHKCTFGELYKIHKTL